MLGLKRKKTTKAVGLSYVDKLDDAPVVSVKGENMHAETIVKIARRYGIPVVKKKELASVLSTLKVDQTIPGQVFEAVAQIMVQIDRKLK